MRARTKWIAAAIAVVAAVGYGWFRYTNGQVFAPILGWRRYALAGDSMEPTMHDGDGFYCEPLGTADIAGLRPGDIVVVIEHNANDRMVVKRVAAQQGDTIEGQGGELLLNGEPEFAQLTVQNLLLDFGAVAVPEEHLYVLGDNFDGSRDSRDLGPIPYADVQCLVHR